MAFEILEPVIYLPDDTPFYLDSGDAHPFLRRFIRAAGLVLLAFAVYIPVYLFAGFVWRDDLLITQNMSLWSWGGLVHVWSQFIAGTYRPLTGTWLWSERHFFHTSAVWYHLVSVGMAGVNGALLWFVLRRLNVRGAWLAAALFVCHPVQLQSIAWASQQAHLLASGLMLGSIWAFLRLSEVRPPLPEEMIPGPGHDIHDLLPPEPVGPLYWTSLTLAALAIFADPLGAVLPIVLLVLIWQHHGRLSWMDGLRLAPFFLIGIGGAVLAILAQRSGVDPSSMGPTLPLGARALVACRAVWVYLANIVWPYQLMFVYPRWSAPGAAWNWIFAAGLVIAIVGAWIGRKRLGRWPLAALVIYLALLLPAVWAILGTAQPSIFVADHLQYLAAAVPLGAIAWGVVVLLARIPSGIAVRLLRFTVTAACLAGFGALAWVYAPNYADEQTLWQATLDQNSANTVARVHFAQLLLRQGMVSRASDLLRDAGDAGQNDPALQLTLGGVLTTEGRYSEAVRYYRTALDLEPTNRETQLELAQAYTNDGRLGEAQRIYADMLASKPSDEVAHNNMGLLLWRMGPQNLSESIEQFKAAVRYNPRYVAAKINLATALFAAGAPTEAAQQLQDAAALEPENFATYIVDATMLYQLKDYANAERMCQVAVKLRPSSAEAWNNLGVAQFAQKRPFEAARSFEKAVLLKPDYAEARKNLQVARERLLSGANN